MLLAPSEEGNSKAVVVHLACCSSNANLSQSGESYDRAAFAYCLGNPHYLQMILGT